MSNNEINETLHDLSGLFQADPAIFEKKSRQLIDALIADFPEDMRQRARSWQFRLDHELNQYKDPVSRMNAMIELFWSGFARFQQAVIEPEQLLAERDESGTVVIPLHRGDIDEDGPFCPLH